MKFRKGYKYQLVEDEIFQTPFRPIAEILTHFITLTTAGIMTVRRDYAWDGASGPTWDTKSSYRGSNAHDALYQLMRMELLPLSCRKDADLFMGQIMKEDKMWHWRANLWVRQLGNFGLRAALPENIKEVYTAP